MVIHVLFILALQFFLLQAVGMTTTALHGHHHSHHTHVHGHHTRPTHEPSISEYFVFHYDAMSVIGYKTYYISTEFELKICFLKDLTI